MGYPDLQSEMEIAQGKTMTKAEDLQPVLLPEQLWEMQQYVEQIYVHDNVAKYIKTPYCAQHKGTDRTCNCRCHPAGNSVGCGQTNNIQKT